MKASLFVTAALACTLASAASAQQEIGRAQPGPAKTGAKSFETPSKVGQANLSAGGATSVKPLSRAGGTAALIAGGAETCGAGTVIAGHGVTHSGNNVGAAMDTPIPCSVSTGAGPAVADVWYSWTASSTGSQVISMCAATHPGGSSDFDNILAVWSSCGGTLLACNDDGYGCDVNPTGDWSATVQFGVTSGTTYKIQIAGFDAAFGTGNYGMFIKPIAAPPANDQCDASVALAGAQPFAFNNEHGTRGNSARTAAPIAEHQTEPLCLENTVTGINSDLWFTWTQTGPTGSMRLNTCTATNPSNVPGWDTKVAVYPAGAGCPAGAPLACDDDSCGLRSQLDWVATMGMTYPIQIGTYPGGALEDQGVGVYGRPTTLTIFPTPTGPANDDCSTPGTTLSGGGPHNFDTSGANTGTQGQAEFLCSGTAVGSDQWFKWFAFATGQATLNTCGGQTAVDTKIAVYTNPGGATACPTSAAIGCNDDNCALQSSVCFPVTAGSAYVIQMGTFPGATGGTGTFGIAINTGPTGVTPCTQDDGVVDNILGYNGAIGPPIIPAEMAWIQRFNMGANFNCGSIQVIWGGAQFPGASPGDGSPAKILLYEDSDLDNDPSTGLSLLQNINTTVTGVDTDTYQTISIPSTLVQDVFFAGASLPHQGAANGQFAAPMDTTCPSGNGNQTWFFGDAAAVPAPDFSNPSASPAPLTSFLTGGGQGCNLLVRVCVTSPMIGECFPGTGGVINCPCPSQAPANPSGGCQNHGAGSTAGGVLSAAGLADLSSDTLVITASGMRPTASVLNVFFSFKPGTGPGTGTPSTGAVSGAGIHCRGTATMSSLKRLYTGNATGGSISRPGMGDQSVSVKSASFAGHAIAPGETRHYFNVYRDGQASQTQNCNSPAVTSNLTNMGAVTWVP